MKKLFTLILMLGITVSTFAQEVQLSQHQQAQNIKYDMEAQLGRVVEKAIEIAETTGEFVVEQAPLLLQEFYRWHITKDLFIIILSILLFISIYFLLNNLFGSKEPFSYYYYGDKKTSIKQQGRYYKVRDSEALILKTVLVICSFISALIFVITHLYNLIFILIAPKLYLIEYFIK